MGKKPSAKKKNKGPDLRGYATVSVAAKKKDEDEAAEEKEETQAPDVATTLDKGADEKAGANGASAAQPDAAEDDREEWELIGDLPSEDESAAPVAANCTKPTAGAKDEDNEGADADTLNDEEWEQAVQRRLDEELLRVEKKYIPADATKNFQRHGGAVPAGVAVLNKVAEQKVNDALQCLRNEDGLLPMIFPKHWRYKGKLTYERVNGIYLALESFSFRGDQIRWAMSKTVGYDVRAPFEFLLANLPKEELPRQFGGEGVSEELAPDKGTRDGAVVSQQASTAEPSEPSVVEPSIAETEPSTTEVELEAADEAADAPTADEPDTEAAEENPPADPPAPVSKQAPAPEPEQQSNKELAKRFAMQYCEDADDDSDDLLDPEERLERERFADPTARYIKLMRQVDELTKLCKTLKDKKKQGAFKQNISADMQKQKQATERLRQAKAEMEELEKGKYGKLDRASVAKEKAEAAQARQQQAPPKPTVPEPSEPAKGSPDAGAAGNKTAPDDTAEAELPSLFGAELDTAAGDAAERPARAPCRCYSLAGWGGRSPKQALEDFVRKRIFGKQSPTVVTTYERKMTDEGRHRATVSVMQPRAQPAKVFDPQEPCEHVKEAENLAAVYALWKLSEPPDHPGLCRSLPPVFRTRWQEWIEEAAARQRDAARDAVKHRVEFVERTLRSSKGGAGVAADSKRQNGIVGVAGGESGQEGPAEVDFQEQSSDEASRMRAAFEQRRQALAESEEYRSIQEVRANLPVAEHRQSLVHVINGSGVTVVGGATGSGKTTQVPQCILEDALEFGAPGDPLPNIIVTEPRRISAVSVAKRVSQELGDPHGGPGSRGSLVGYQIRLERKVAESTRLLFCTVGVLLRKMQSAADALARVTHVFVDEVHERSAECDLLLLLLKQIRQSRPDLHIVPMSATLEMDKLVRYFGKNVPVMTIPGRTFPVESYWLEDLVEMSGYRLDDDSDFAKRGWNKDWMGKKTFNVTAQGGKTEKIVAYIDDDDDWAVDDEAECCDPSVYSEDTQRTLAKMDHSRINFDLIEATLELIEFDDKFSHVPRDEGAILIFLPGMMEITKLHERLLRTRQFGDKHRALVLSLHSVLSGEEHAKAFERPPRGVRKIVLSTNIAETGVTIPDVVFVIDSGKVKSQRYHEPSNTSSLKEQFISRAETKQRLGRAGRVREGFSFHLITRARFDLRFQEMPTPEILRCSLMELMLSVLSSGLQPGCFSQALDPPPDSRINQAVATLRATGAVEEGQRPANAPQFFGVNDEVWYVVTPVGQCLAKLPCDVRLGKMVLFAALFGCLESVWTVAATLSHRSPLSQPFLDSKRAQAKQVHCAELLPKDGPPSDHLALNTAYVRWDEARRGRGGVESFCRKSWLNGPVLQTIRDIRHDLVDSLKNDGFCEHFDKKEVPPQDLNSPHNIAGLIFAGLYPNVARVDAPKAVHEKHPLLSCGAEQLKIHPGSLCHGHIEGLQRTNHRWICYHTKMKTSQVFLRDATFLAPNALMLFGGEPSTMNIYPVEKSVSIGLGAERQWQVMYCAPRSAVLLRQLRYAFDALLRRKASTPRQPLSQADRSLIISYIAVLNSVEVES